MRVPVTGGRPKRRWQRRRIWIEKWSGYGRFRYDDIVHDELTLLAKARAFDEEALAQIHDTYYGPIFRYIAFRVSDQTVAEDLTGEVFVRLLSALRDRTAPQKTLRGWLYRVAYFVVSDYYRIQYRQEEVPLDEELSDGRELSGDAPDPAAVVSSKMRWEEVGQALEHLTHDQREVIALRFGQELPIREVADLMDKSEGAVKQLQARAVAALSRHLRQET